MSTRLSGSLYDGVQCSNGHSKGQVAAGARALCIEIATAQRARPLELRATLSWTTLRISQGRTNLRTAASLARFIEGFVTARLTLSKRRGCYNSYQKSGATPLPR